MSIKFFATQKNRRITLKLIYGDNYAKYFTDSDNDVGILDSLIS